MKNHDARVNTYPMKPWAEHNAPDGKPKLNIKEPQKSQSAIVTMVRMNTELIIDLKTTPVRTTVKEMAVLVTAQAIEKASSVDGIIVLLLITLAVL